MIKNDKYVAVYVILWERVAILAAIGLIVLIVSLCTAPNREGRRVLFENDTSNTRKGTP